MMSIKQNRYQGGPSCEVFTPQGSNPIANCRLVGVKGIQKVYDKSAKGFVFDFHGSPSCRMLLPKEEHKSSLHLVQPFLVLQLFLPERKHFSLELSVSDTTNTRRKLYISTSFSDVKITPLHCQLPLLMVRRDAWLNLAIYTHELVGGCFRGLTFRSLDAIAISPVCKLRKIFTMRKRPLSGEADDAQALLLGLGEQIPHDLAFAPGVESFIQLLDINLIQQVVQGQQLSPSMQGTGRLLQFKAVEPTVSARALPLSALASNVEGEGTHTKPQNSTKLADQVLRGAVSLGSSLSTSSCEDDASRDLSAPDVAQLHHLGAKEKGKTLSGTTRPANAKTKPKSDVHRQGLGSEAKRSPEVRMLKKTPASSRCKSVIDGGCGKDVKTASVGKGTAALEESESHGKEGENAGARSMSGGRRAQDVSQLNASSNRLEKGKQSATQSRHIDAALQSSIGEWGQESCSGTGFRIDSEVPLWGRCSGDNGLGASADEPVGKSIYGAKKANDRYTKSNFQDSELLHLRDEQGEVKIVLGNVVAPESHAENKFEIVQSRLFADMAHATSNTPSTSSFTQSHPEATGERLKLELVSRSGAGTRAAGYKNVHFPSGYEDSASLSPVQGGSRLRSSSHGGSPTSHGHLSLVMASGQEEEHHDELHGVIAYSPSRRRSDGDAQQRSAGRTGGTWSRVTRSRSRMSESSAIRSSCLSVDCKASPSTAEDKSAVMNIINCHTEKYECAKYRDEDDVDDYAIDTAASGMGDVSNFRGSSLHAHNEAKPRLVAEATRERLSGKAAAKVAAQEAESDAADISPVHPDLKSLDPAESSELASVEGVVNPRSGDSSFNMSDEQNLDLLYDPILNCYYDPKTNSFYELQ